MTAYVITGDCNIRQLGTLSPSGSATARAGGDTIDTNGFNFTIDQDTRYGLTGTTSTSFGNMTVNATKGGSINIDGRYVRLVPFTGGSGTITAGSTITCGSATGVVIGIYSSMTTAPVLTGVATGWIKVTAWNQIAFPTSGAFTQAGFTFTISGPSIVGCIDIVGDEAAGIIANRLGVVNILGDWYELGTTNGARSQTFQIPNNGLLKHFAGVWIETAVGAGTYEFYCNGGTTTTTTTTVATGVEAARGKVVWINSEGLVTIGNSGGTGLNGYLPVTGLKVRVPNVHLENCTTAVRAANVIPNSTLATRYDFTTTGGGAINISVAHSCWYPSFVQAYSVNLSYFAVIDAMVVSEVATEMNWTQVCVGNKPTTALLTPALTMSLCFAGGTFTDCVFARVSQASSAQYTTVLTDIANFTFVRDTHRANTNRGNATVYSVYGTRCVNCTWTNPRIVQSSMYFVQSDSITITDTQYVDCVSGTTVTTYAMYVWSLASSCKNFTISGLTMPVTNCQPYTALLALAGAGASVAGISNIKLRNIGTRVAPLSMGSTNNTGLILVLGASGAIADVKVQRVYVATTRTGIMTGDNSATRITFENVFGDYADAADVAPMLNFVRKGIGGTLAVTAQTSVYGTHWYDCFTSTTAGRIGLMMNEPTSLTTSQVTLSNGAAFTSAGGLYMPVIGQQVVFETPYYILGHTAFPNTSATMAGGTIGNYNFRFQIDKNDGAGYSAWSSTTTAASLATALNAVTGINAAKGFKLKLEVKTVTTNTTAITSLYIPTTSSTTAQDYQYPLDSNNVTFTGLPTGTDVVVLTAGTNTILASVDAGAGTSYTFTYSGAQTIDVGFIKPGYIPQYIRNLALTATDSSIPVSMTADRNYI